MKCAKWGSIALWFSAKVFAIEPALIGGVKVERGDFPEIVYISNGMARCSATIIGPEVILTAAHCAADQGSISQVDFVIDQVVFRAKCEQAPMYRDELEDHDMALCKTDKPLAVKYASVAKEGPKVGDKVTLSGYGCIRQGGGGGNDGVLRVGSAPLTELPHGDYDWFTTVGSTALCYGDSGGPAFLYIANPQEELHYVVGVNSRGDIKSESLLTALWIDKSKKFFQDFAQRNKVEICGINRDCQPDLSHDCAKLKLKAEKAQAKYEQCKQGEF
jgi:secreted trypsin-like serine protease